MRLSHVLLVLAVFSDLVSCLNLFTRMERKVHGFNQIHEINSGTIDINALKCLESSSRPSSYYP